MIMLTCGLEICYPGMPMEPLMSSLDRDRAMRELGAYVDKAKRMSGWTFEVEAKPLGPALPWNYVPQARALVADAASVLDLGTGGGEVFAELCQGYAGRAVATESWLPNVAVAAERLSAKGILTTYASSRHLPFADASFELVIDQHEDLSPVEVVRVLAPGGHLLTQQVANSNWQELREFFPRMTNLGPHFELYQDGFRNGGLTVTRAETHDAQEAYRSLGEFVYMLVATPWTIPEFDVERDLDALLAFERSVTREHGLVLTNSHYVIEAHKPR